MNENISQDAGTQKEKVDRPVSVAQWLGLWALLMIPVVNIIVAIVFCFIGNDSRKNYFKAMWIALAIASAVLAIGAMIFYFSGGYEEFILWLRQVVHEIPLRF